MATLKGEKIKEFDGKYNSSCLDNPFIKLPCGDVEGGKIKEPEAKYDLSRMVVNRTGGGSYTSSHQEEKAHLSSNAIGFSILL